MLIIVFDEGIGNLSKSKKWFFAVLKKDKRSLFAPLSIKKCHLKKATFLLHNRLELRTIWHFLSMSKLFCSFVLRSMAKKLSGLGHFMRAQCSTSVVRSRGKYFGNFFARFTGKSLGFLSSVLDFRPQFWDFYPQFRGKVLVFLPEY